MQINAIVQPYFDYRSPLWVNWGIGLKYRLQKYQNPAARVTTEATYDIRSSDLLENLKLETSRRKTKLPLIKSIFIHKILNGHTE